MQSLLSTKKVLDKQLEREDKHTSPLVTEKRNERFEKRILLRMKKKFLTNESKEKINATHRFEERLETGLKKDEKIA